MDWPKLDWRKSATTEGWGTEGWGPEGLGPFSGIWVWVCKVWSAGLNVGLWVFGWAFWVHKIWPKTQKTLKLAKVGLAKVGQHFKTLKLAKVTIGQSRSKGWPKSVWAKLAMTQLSVVWRTWTCRGSSFGFARVARQFAAYPRCSPTTGWCGW